MRDPAAQAVSPSSARPLGKLASDRSAAPD